MCEGRGGGEGRGGLPSAKARGQGEVAGAGFFDCCIVIVALYDGVWIFSPLSVLVRRAKAVKNTLSQLHARARSRTEVAL